MSLFDDIAGSLLGGQGAPDGLLGAITGLVNQVGGLEGLVSLFNQHGLGEIINSWIGAGENLPISPEQLQQVFGNNQLGQLASQLGLSPDQVGNVFSAMLPQVISNLAPNGQIEAGGLMETGLDLLKSRLLG